MKDDETVETIDDEQEVETEIKTTLEEYLSQAKENQGPIIITQREYKTNIIYK